MYVSMYICMFVCMFTKMNKNPNSHLAKHMSTHMYINVCAYVHMYVYIRMYICMYIQYIFLSSIGRPSNVFFLISAEHSNLSLTFNGFVKVFCAQIFLRLFYKPCNKKQHIFLKSCKRCCVNFLSR